MQHQKAKELFLKFQAGQCNEEERAMMEYWITFGEAGKFDLSEQEFEEHLKDLDLRMGLGPEVKKHNFIRAFTAAAAILIISCTGLYYYISAPTQTAVNSSILSQTKDIGPGGNFATLTLSDGKSINLNSARDQIIVQKDGLSILNTKNSELIYTSNNDFDHTNNLIAANTLTTPRGGQYRVSLPDGTKVWLNSASSLKFPAHFIGNERLVQLTGEAYFEVTKNSAMPFRVIVNSTTVKVLGTHFNINAYGDMPSIKTTLLEGSIQLSNGAINKLLKPNQQGVVDKTGSIKITDVDPDQAVAWKNGYFSFKRTSLREIMQQISRWYNVDIIYNGKVSADDDFVGKINRGSNLSKTLQILELSGVHFKVKDRQIIVTPK